MGEQVGFKVVWTDTAIANVDSICQRIARDDPDAALRMGRGILEHGRLLAQFPFIGPCYPRGTRGSLREIVFRDYRIFYDVIEETRRVDILHVWHGARDEPGF